MLVRPKIMLSSVLNPRFLSLYWTMGHISSFTVIML